VTLRELFGCEGVSLSSFDFLCVVYIPFFAFAMSNHIVIFVLLLGWEGGVTFPDCKQAIEPARVGEFLLRSSFPTALRGSRRAEGVRRGNYTY